MAITDFGIMLESSRVGCTRFVTLFSCDLGNIHSAVPMCTMCIALLHYAPCLKYAICIYLKHGAVQLTQGIRFPNNDRWNWCRNPLCPIFWGFCVSGVSESYESNLLWAVFLPYGATLWSWLLLPCGAFSEPRRSAWVVVCLAAFLHRDFID